MHVSPAAHLVYLLLEPPFSFEVASTFHLLKFKGQYVSCRLEPIGSLLRIDMYSVEYGLFSNLQQNFFSESLLPSRAQDDRIGTYSGVRLTRTPRLCQAPHRVL